MTRMLRAMLPRVNRAFDTVSALALLLAIFVAANLERMPDGAGGFFSARIGVKNVVALLLFAAIWNAAFAAAGLHQPPIRQRLSRQAARIVLACSIGTLPLLAFPWLSYDAGFRLEMVAVFWAAAIVVEIIGRTLMTLAARYAAERATGTVRVMVVGSGPRTLKLFERIQAEPLAHLRVLGFVDSPGTHPVAFAIRERMLGTLDDLESLLAGNAVDQVLITLPVKSCYDAIQDAISTCERVGVEVHYLSDVFSASMAKSSLTGQDDLEATRLSFVTDDYRVIVKRVFDVTAALCGLLVLSPVLLVCAWLVRRSGPGPILFTQQRYGYNRRRFEMYKFRTMVADAEQLQASLESQNEASGPVFKIRRDPRITPIGRILRKTSLDELPQLFNVLKGDMSIVGPRPLPVRDVSRFHEARLMRRFSVRPGITCLWQITGRSDTDFDRWVQLDLDYIDNWSLALDARILVKTVPAVLAGTGAA
ncbi:MAG: sugar transferase [Acidobacteria bacterium]|nr:sugar transferase [Acidobacteriota bacterium]